MKFYQFIGGMLLFCWAVLLGVLVTGVVQAALVIKVDEPFDCLPAPWNEAKVIRCTPSRDADGRVHMFCHFELEE